MFHSSIANIRAHLLTIEATISDHAVILTCNAIIREAEKIREDVRSGKCSSTEGKKD